MRKIFVLLIATLVLLSSMVYPVTAESSAPFVTQSSFSPSDRFCLPLTVIGVGLAAQEQSHPCDEIDAKVDAEIARQEELGKEWTSLLSAKAEREAELQADCPQDLSIIACTANSLDIAGEEFDADIAAAKVKYDEQVTYVDQLIEEKRECHAEYLNDVSDNRETVGVDSSDEEATVIANTPNNGQPPSESGPTPAGNSDVSFWFSPVSPIEMIGGGLLGLGALAIGWHLIHDGGSRFRDHGKVSVISNNPDVSVDNFRESMREEPTLLSYNARGEKNMSSNNNPYAFHNQTREEKARIRELAERAREDLIFSANLSSEDQRKIQEYRRLGYGEGFSAVTDTTGATAKVGVEYIGGIAKGKAGGKVPWWGFIQTLKEWTQEVGKAVDKHNEGKSKPKSKR